MNPHDEIVIGVSACLVGQEVRYDGRHKLEPALESLGASVRFVPVCPEVGIGLGVPRDPIRLVRVDGAERLVATVGAADHTSAMLAFAHAQCDRLDAIPSLVGFIVKSGSPSCGLARVPIFGDDGAISEGAGLFTRVLRERRPDLAVEDELGLNDPARRARFVGRIDERRQAR